jgi:hypothetical protein
MIWFQQLAQEYHPGKNYQEVMGLSAVEALDFFKLLNNTDMFLQEQMLELSWMGISN